MNAWASFDWGLGGISQLRDAVRLRLERCWKSLGANSGAEIMVPLRPYLSGRTWADAKTIRVQASDERFRRGQRYELDRHCRMLAQEFAGRTEIELYHSLLIVLVRRELFERAPARAFLRLWRQESDFLCSRLNSRWLVSACDTLCDVAPTPEDRSLALAVSLLLNTIKLYETERALTLDLTQRMDTKAFLQQADHVPLFDGMTAFLVGHGDMVCNLYRRAEQVARRQGGVVSRIAREVLARIKQQDTVYCRFHRRHVRESTQW